MYIGLDLGTSGCRAVAIDAAGALWAGAHTALAPPRRTGESSQQAPELWWEAVMEVLARLAENIPAAEVAALAVDGTSATLLAADERGRPLGPALMYNDSRCRVEAREVAAVSPADSAARGAGAGLAKALYLARRHPGARHLLHQADWIGNRLCGRFGIADENNCLKLGFDPLQRCWPRWLGRLDLDPRLLPEVLPAGHPVGTLDRPIATRLGLPSEARVVAGTTDSTAAVLATGAAEPGDAVTSLGSTLVLKVVSPAPVFAPRFGVYSHRVGGRWLAGGASNSGGAVLLQHFSPDQLQAMTPRLLPERPTGLDYYPLPAPGERFPVADPDLPPRLSPRPEDPVAFFQAMLEGMSRIEAEGYQLLARLGAPYPRSVRTVGGGAANPAWRAMRQHLLGVPVIEPEHTEAAYGAALLARAGAHSE
ncbi:MAG: FGGY-family carbohydrate kinase [Gammaproteobacteria bacterium]|nr:FGGY-family carbohydrate kinase [Gammaproteobacteria bacterium]NIR97772.1 FGGY-family carbohydrate kinase [Gammaproteobacteria bacterium]NIT63482.1 FGGY-family carbohydrate kinase [Gammaproteobacteria bacterium]NIV20420.1 carbohydrate kinase [Gammaproteobacteria bacterium]NIX10994.1 carbohydrate kinase [Gammaproteobacteria bacterium]